MGRHTCLYYDSEKSLLDLVHSFFEKGLKENKLCLWVVPLWLGIEGAKAALKEKLNDLDLYIEKNQFEFLSHDEVYLRSGIFNHDNAVTFYSKKEQDVLDLGFSGLCVSGDASWVQQEDWNKVIAYEMEADRLINQKEIAALCTYPAKKFDIVNMFSLSFSHDLILKRGDEEMDILIDKRDIRK
jgi:hypothetical protein